MKKNVEKQKPPDDYEERYWLEQFSAATDNDKSATAVAWIEHNLADFANVKGHAWSWLEQAIATTDMQAVRNMVWSVPPGHPALAQAALQAAEAGPQKPADWLRHFYTTGIHLVTTEPGFESLGLLRDMWLQPHADKRRGALLELAASSTNLDGMGTSFDCLILDAAWDVAGENGMDDAVVDAAAKLTLWTYRGRDGIGGKVRSDIANAFLLMASRSEMATLANLKNYSDERTKSLLVPYPAVCIRLLMLVDERAKLAGLASPKDPSPAHGKDVPRGPNGPGPQTRLGHLRTWLPSKTGAIDAAIAIGMSYSATLEQLAQGLVTDPEVDLPVDLSAPAPGDSHR
jgi:hypothetical protein